ncbi:HNH endonuclease [Nocardioides albus]|uniref:HNH nuclease domain-containing protein n=1 Tax=Nocardioides albus TaxID=1841 RepID=A0A7W5A9G3_9ACTN|nr:HNH endonuclease signature motif containing protein [Nocardioides albus]MBB3092143.1 hypothetical protein [Nocardioides albus]
MALIKQAPGFAFNDDPDWVARRISIELKYEEPRLKSVTANHSHLDAATQERRVTSQTQLVENWRNAVAVVEFVIDREDKDYPLTRELLELSESTPSVLTRDTARRTYWLFQRRAYVSSDDRLTPEDVKALVNEAENRRRLRLEKAHALQAMREQVDQRGKRQPIPQDVKVAVWQRDGGRCVECGSQENLEFDHIIPLAMGGSNTMRNLQLLCADCNQRKGATLG